MEWYEEHVKMSMTEIERALPYLNVSRDMIREAKDGPYNETERNRIYSRLCELIGGLERVEEHIAAMHREYHYGDSE